MKNASADSDARQQNKLEDYLCDSSWEDKGLESFVCSCLNDPPRLQVGSNGCRPARSHPPIQQNVLKAQWTVCISNPSRAGKPGKTHELADFHKPPMLMELKALAFILKGTADWHTGTPPFTGWLLLLSYIHTALNNVRSSNNFQWKVAYVHFEQNSHMHV